MYLLSCAVSKLWLIICQIFASDRGSLHFNAHAWVIPCEYVITDIPLKLDSLGYILLAECMRVSSTTFTS